MVGGLPDCCALTTSGQVRAAPPLNIAMKSRRRISVLNDQNAAV
jgi:hypothetical protein